MAESNSLRTNIVVTVTVILIIVIMFGRL